MRPLLPLVCALALCCGGSKPPRKLVLLHTNDEHSHLLGFGPEADDFTRRYLAAAPVAGATIQGGASRRAVALNAEREAARAAGGTWSH